MLRVWHRESTSGGPHARDVEVFRRYLARVVREERDMDKAAKLVRWLEYLVEEDGAGEGRGEGEGEDVGFGLRFGLRFGLKFRCCRFPLAGTYPEGPRKGRTRAMEIASWPSPG